MCSNDYTQYTFFQYKKENRPKLSQICSYGIFFLGTEARVGTSHGKRAISVPAIEVLLYIKVAECETSLKKRK